MSTENALIGDVDICIRGRHKIPGVACTARVEDMHTVNVLIIAAVGVPEKNYLCIDVLGLLKELVSGVLYCPSVSVSEEYLQPCGRHINIAGFCK